jgi:hypothetical protein
MREVWTCECSRRCVVRRWASVGDEKPRAPKTDDASAGNAHLYNLSRARSRAVRAHVWTTYGGWFADPKAWKRNTLGGFVALGALSFATWNYSRKIEVR